jgi:hypothetical protein
MNSLPRSPHRRDFQRLNPVEHTDFIRAALGIHRLPDILLGELVAPSAMLVNKTPTQTPPAHEA